MTDIKSAIEFLQKRIHSTSKEYKMAIRSFNAWSEVLNELEEEKWCIGTTLDQREAYENCIDIINQKLVEIEKVENPNGVYSLYNFLKELVEDGTITEKNDNTKIYFQDDDGVMHQITDYSFDQDRELVLWE